MKHGLYSMKQFPDDLQLQGHRFIQHRRNAQLRGVEWQFNFDEWWGVWEKSGRWAERGWGAEKYCMCRFGDVGPYAAHNVFIATNSENSAAIDRSKTIRHVGQAHLKAGKLYPIGVRKTRYGTFEVRKKRVQIGTFPTVEMAQAAYQNFVF